MQYVVKRNEHVLEVRRDDAVAAWFSVAVGSPKTPTPAGRWAVTVGPWSGDPDVVGTLSTQALCCLRSTADLASLGHDASGG